MILDNKQNFEERLRTTPNKLNNTLEFFRRLQKNLSRQSLLTIDPAFIRLHLDYDGIIFDQSYSSSFHQKL